jgi:hypothetical protein
MKLFYDDLLFDNRNRDDLFAVFNSGQPFYADILKRWAIGMKVSENELSIVTSILIFYPEYVLKNGQAEEFIELIQYSLQKHDSENQSNQERGLLLYNLLFLLLKLGKREESVTVLLILEKLLTTFSKSNNLSHETQQQVSDTDSLIKSSEPDYSLSPACLENAYKDIITRIMNEGGILSLKSGFNISQLPVPFDKLSGQEGHNLRSQAFDYYDNNELDKASAVYHKMLVYKFELPGTLTHLVRLELVRGNIPQAGIFIVNAWRLRHEAPVYVMARILFFIIFLKMLRSEQFTEWPGCLKYILNQPDSKMYWEMDRIVTQNEKEVIPQHLCFLRSVLEVISGADEEVNLNKLEIWKDAAPIVFEEWPDFDIVF